MTGRVASWFPWISHMVVLVVSTHADTRNLLMIDDHDILYHAGTKRILEPLDRGPAVGKPALSATEPWEQVS